MKKLFIRLFRGLKLISRFSLEQEARDGKKKLYQRLLGFNELWT